MAGGTVRAERVHATREAILTAAERLFAEHGLLAVSNRQISEAAGQGNTAAVGYHFGTKADLVHAIVRRHITDIERIRARMVAATAGSTELRDWVACLVRPHVEHLAGLGGPTWFARFSAQVMTDPELRRLMSEDTQHSPVLRQTIDGLNRCLPELPAAVRRERDDMARLLMLHVAAERERALAEGISTNRDSWQDVGAGLTDAIYGLLTAPVITSYPEGIQ